MENKIQVDTTKPQRDNCYDMIRVIATLMIVLHHFFTTADDYSYYVFSFLPFYREGALLYDIGRIGVVIFCVLSGALLIKRYNEKLKVKEYFKKRVLRVLIPHMVCFLIVFGYYWLTRPTYFQENWIFSAILSFIGLDYFGTFMYEHFGFWNMWLVGEWFTSVILILYVLFPLLRWVYKKNKSIPTILITILFFANLKYEILTYGGGWFSITNCLMCFWVGMLLEPIKHKFNKWVILVCSILAIGLLIWNPQNILSFMYLPVFIMGVLLFIIMTKLNFKSRPTDYLCKYSFEIYLIHHRVFILIIPLIGKYLTTTAGEILFFIILMWVTCKLSELLQKLVNLVIKGIDKIHLPTKKMEIDNNKSLEETSVQSNKDMDKTSDTKISE